MAPPTAPAAPDFRAIVESSPDPYLILATDPDFTIVGASDAYLRATMTRRQDVVDQPLFTVFPENPETPTGGVDKLRASLESVLREKRPHAMLVVKYDIPRPAEQGGGFDERHWSPVNTPVFDAQGEVRHIIHRVVDVTELVRSRERGTHLEQELLARTREVEEQRRQLTVENQRKDEFLAMLGHELRNPLAALRTALELVWKDPTNPPKRETLSVMERQLSSLVRMVDDLLNVSRVSRGVIQLQRAPLDLQALTRDALEGLRPLADDAGVAVSLAPSEEPIGVYGDAVRLEQVVNNLVTNAIKFTSAGGHVHVEVAAEDDMARLAVRDDGAGMEPSLLERAFHLFVQGPQDASRSASGLGIGLTIVQQLVELHAGTVDAHSDGPGRGTEITVTLPRVELAKPAPTRPTPPPLDTSAHALRILVVDDNMDAASLLTEVLRRQGHRAEAAHTGREGLTRAEHLRPDLVFLDIGLPDLDGYALARHFRAQGDPPRLVAVTGYGQREDRARAREAGFDDFLVKPASLQAITRCIREAGRGRPCNPTTEPS